ncbi:hypothetical protein [uncultured Methylobacterium sp.]|uniref:hypothetical protein n=1 Tax=uncultured Methylobacterium sp. TaxID=157278 RepID=UPI00259AE5D0|nr:hypothetical protein [uncultured Methylobacterium sp.]
MAGGIGGLVGGAVSALTGGGAAGGAAGGGDSFAANLAQLKQVSEEQQQKSMELRMVSAKLGTEQNAAKEKPQQ